MLRTCPSQNTEYMLDVTALRALYEALPWGLDVSACSSLSDFYHAVTCAVGDNPSHVLHRDDFHGTLIVNHDAPLAAHVSGTHDAWVAHTAIHVQPKIQFLAGGTPNGTPPTTLSMLRDPSSRSLAPCGWLLFLLGSSYTPAARRARCSLRSVSISSGLWLETPSSTGLARYCRRAVRAVVRRPCSSRFAPGPVRRFLASDASRT